MTLPFLFTNLDDLLGPNMTKKTLDLLNNVSSHICNELKTDMYQSDTYIMYCTDIPGCAKKDF